MSLESLKASNKMWSEWGSSLEALGRVYFWDHSCCWYCSVPFDCGVEGHSFWPDIIWGLHLIPRSCSLVFICSFLGLPAISSRKSPSHMSHAWLTLLPSAGESSQLLRAHAGHLDNWFILRSTVTYKINITTGVTAQYIQILGTRAGHLWGNILEILLTGYKNLVLNTGFCGN